MSKAKKAQKVKEELRRLTTVGENKTCMDCNERGPLYVVTDFHIFVCTTCSAIHRSLQHKVKGISMSDFSDDEVAALRVGGNARAEEIYKCGYRGAKPAQGKEAAIRDYIEQIFVQRRYFSAEEFNKLQDEIAAATLPTVQPLPASMLPPSAAPLHPPSEQQPSSSASASQPEAPKPQMQQQPQLYSAQASGAPATSADAFDDFFASRHAAQPQPQARPPVDDATTFFGDFSSAPSARPTATATATATVATPSIDDLFSAPVQQHQHGATAPAPSPPSTSTFAAQQQLLQQQSSYGGPTRRADGPDAMYAVQQQLFNANFGAARVDNGGGGHLGAAGQHCYSPQHAAQQQIATAGAAPPAFSGASQDAAQFQMSTPTAYRSAAADFFAPPPPLPVPPPQQQQQQQQQQQYHQQQYHQQQQQQSHSSSNAVDFFAAPSTASPWGNGGSLHSAGPPPIAPQLPTVPVDTRHPPSTSHVPSSRAFADDAFAALDPFGGKGR